MRPRGPRGPLPPSRCARRAFTATLGLDPSVNATACKQLLENLVARGVKPGRRRLFVTDGSKAMPAAYRLAPAEGMARLEQQASWLEADYPEAAVSLREGLAETFTVNEKARGRQPGSPDKAEAGGCPTAPQLKMPQAEQGGTRFRESACFVRPLRYH